MVTLEVGQGKVIAAAVAKTDFLYFLKWVQVQSDNPDNPGAIPWQPWPHLVERAEAWQAGKSEVILKARQLGATWLVAAYIAWRARNGWNIGYFSKGQAEARDTLRRVAYIEEHLPDWLKTAHEALADEVRYRGAGRIHAFPSTENAGISYTLQLAVMDEIAFHPYGRANYAAVRPALSAGGQFIAPTTADPELGSAGFFYELWERTGGTAPSHDWTISPESRVWHRNAMADTPYDAVFLPWNARPDRDLDWLERERKAFAGLPEDFDAYFPGEPEDAFRGRAGLVYPQFSRTQHISRPPVPWKDCVFKVAGVDFGGGDPNAVIIAGMDRKQNVHIYEEYVEKGSKPADWFVGNILQHDGIQLVACDRSQGTTIETIDRAVKPYGARAIASKAGKLDGIKDVSFLLENNRLTVGANCKHLISEFGDYRWAERFDSTHRTRYQTRTPADHHGDALDALRYNVVEMLYFMRRGRSAIGRTLSGRPRARKAV